MKSAIIALLVATTQALKDAPPAFNQPPYTEKSPSAAGFVQTSACLESGNSGVTCTPANEMLFAEGMNGDEDLSMDITMKGNKYHVAQATALAQQVPAGDKVEVRTPWSKRPFCNGVNGPVNVNCRIPMCNGTNGPKDGPVGAGNCYQEYAYTIPSYSSDPTRGREFRTTGDRSSSYPDVAYWDTEFVMTQKEEAKKSDLSFPEKIIDLSATPRSVHRSTYY